MSGEHPLVRAAVQAEEEISRQLHQELEIACRGVEVELRLAKERAETLAEQLADTRGRLAKLGSLRATYSNLITDVQQRGSLLAAAQRELSEARSSQAGAHSASLIYTIDAPDAGARPVGPGRLTIALAGVAAGLLVGASILFLSLPIGSESATNTLSAPMSPSFAVPAVSPLGKQTAPLSVRKALKKTMATA